MSKYEDLRGAAANSEIIVDDLGIPSVMVKIPLIYLNGLGIGGAEVPHPAFVINDKVVPYIYVSKYINVVKHNRAYSLPNQDPAVSLNFDRAVEVCYNKGPGWHLMTAAEWGLLHNKITAAGLEPRGNTNHGRSYERQYETGVVVPGVDKPTERTLTGTGGRGWCTDLLGDGVYDLIGNVKKWVVARLVDGEIQVIPNNNAAIHDTDLSADSSAWRAILEDGTYVVPGTEGTLKYDYITTEGWNYQLSTVVEDRRVAETPYGENDFGLIVAKNGLRAPDLLKALALFPNSDKAKTGRGRLSMNNSGERILARGGNVSSADRAGEAEGSFLKDREYTNEWFGLFSAYVDPTLYA